MSRGDRPDLGVLVFRLSEVRYGLRDEDVVEVLPAVSLVPLPDAPPIVEGLADVRGTIVPVLDLRKRLKLPPKPLSPSDHFVVTNLPGRQVALRVDRAEAFTQIDASSFVTGEQAIPGLGLVAGAARLPDGLVLIHDPARFLTEAEELSLAQALAR